jgi:hypothetical protein
MYFRIGPLARAVKSDRIAAGVQAFRLNAQALVATHRTGRATVSLPPRRGEAARAEGLDEDALKIVAGCCRFKAPFGNLQVSRGPKRRWLGPPTSVTPP